MYAIRSYYGIDHQQQLNQVFVHGTTGRLDDKNIPRPHIFIDFDLNLSVTEPFNLLSAKRNIEIFTSYNFV